MREIDLLQQVHDDMHDATEVLEKCESKLQVEIDKDVLRIAKNKLIIARGWLATLISWLGEENDN